MKKILTVLTVFVLGACAAFQEEKPALTCDYAESTVKIIYEDDAVVVVNKPAAVAVAGEDGSLQDMLKLRAVCASSDDTRFLPVDKMSRGASGLMIFAKNKNALAEMTAQFENLTAAKKYRLVVEGVIRRDNGNVKLSVETVEGKVRVAKDGEGRSAKTEYKVVRRVGKFSELEATTSEPDADIVRAHLSAIGYPLMSDNEYKARRSRGFMPVYPLQSYYLKFQRPGTNEYMEIDLTPSDKIKEAIFYAEQDV